MTLTIMSPFQHVINTYVISYMFVDSYINIGFFGQTPLARYFYFTARLSVLLLPQANEQF